MSIDESVTSAIVRTMAMPSAPSPVSEVAPASPPPFIDSLELEALALILEHSLKIHTAHHFFCWTQGLLQNLIRHEILICALRKSDSAAFYVDSFSSAAADPSLISNLFIQDTILVPHLLKCWEEKHFEPVMLNTDVNTSMAGSPLVREFKRLGSPEILAHGTYDASGRPASFFVFACQPGALMPEKSHLVELLVPSLHAAWMHTQFTRPAASNNVQTGGNEQLTVREQEILGWIYRGKSNIEIGMILGISPLTVKNHVQKILRRLGVLNRAQAVGKALVLRILDGSVQR